MAGQISRSWMVNGECLFLRWEGSKYAEMTTAIIIKYLQIKIDCGNSVTPQPLPDRGGGSSYSLTRSGEGWGGVKISAVIHSTDPSAKSTKCYQPPKSTHVPAFTPPLTLHSRRDPAAVGTTISRPNRITHIRPRSHLFGTVKKRHAQRYYLRWWQTQCLSD